MCWGSPAMPGGKHTQSSQTRGAVAGPSSCTSTGVVVLPPLHSVLTNGVVAVEAIGKQRNLHAVQKVVHPC